MIISDIRSVGDFLNVINNVYPSTGMAFFRGQESNKYDISSSLCRFIEKEKVSFANKSKVAEELFYKFKRKFPAYPEFSYLKNYNANDFDILMTAQHYGMPTRLIDWTLNPLVALYFAVEMHEEREKKRKKTKKKEEISVYVLKGSNEKKIKLCSGESIIDELDYEEKTMKLIFRIIKDNSYYPISLSLYRDDKSIENSNAIEEIRNSASEILKNIDRILDESKYTEASESCLLTSCASEYTNCHHFMRYIKNNIAIFTNISRTSKYGIVKVALLYEELLKKLVDKVFRIISNNKLTVVARSICGNEYIMIEPLPINNRIKNQQGFFLVSTENECPEFFHKKFNIGKNIISSVEDSKNNMECENVIRIDINDKYSKEIKNELYRYGIRKSFIYPELSSFTEEAKIETLFKCAAD